MSPRRRSTRVVTEEEVRHNRAEATRAIADQLQEELADFNARWQQNMKALKYLWRDE